MGAPPPCQAQVPDSRILRVISGEADREGLTTDSTASLSLSLCLLFIGHRLLFQGSYVDTSAAYWQRAASRIIGVIVVGIPRSPYGSRPKPRSPPLFSPRHAFPHRGRPSRGHLSLRDCLIIFNCQSCSVRSPFWQWRTIIAYEPPYARHSSRGNFSKSMPASEPRRFRFFSARYFYENCTLVIQK